MQRQTQEFFLPQEAGRTTVGKNFLGGPHIKKMHAVIKIYRGFFEILGGAYVKNIIKFSKIQGVFRNFAPPPTNAQKKTLAFHYIESVTQLIVAYRISI